MDLSGLASARAALKPTSTVTRFADGRICVTNPAGSPDPEPAATASDRMFFVVDTADDREIAQVHPGLFIGSEDGAANLSGLQRHQVTNIVNAAYPDVDSMYPEHFRYHNIHTSPRVSPQSTMQMFCLRVLSTFHRLSVLCCDDVHLQLSRDGRVLIHCQAGVSRSAALVAAVLLHRELARDVDAAIEIIRRVRPQACPNPLFRKELSHYFKCKRPID